MGFSTRILDVILTLHHLTELDLDVILTTTEPPSIILDTVLTAAYGVTEEGDINEFTAIRVVKPAGDGDRLVYLPPDNPAYDRHSREIILGKTGVENSSDIYRGDITVLPGRSINGVTKTLLMKSESGISLIEIPDTPVVSSGLPIVYDADELFELLGINFNKSLHIQWDEEIVQRSVVHKNLIGVSPIRKEWWLREDKGTFVLLFDPLTCHVNEVSVTSTNVQLDKITIHGLLPFPFEDGQVTIDTSWHYSDDLTRELNISNASIWVHIEAWDLTLGSVTKTSESYEIVFGEGSRDYITKLAPFHYRIIFGSAHLTGAKGNNASGVSYIETVDYFGSKKLTSNFYYNSSCYNSETLVRYGYLDEKMNSLNLLPYGYAESHYSNISIEIQRSMMDIDINIAPQYILSLITQSFTNIISW